MKQKKARIIIRSIKLPFRKESVRLAAQILFAALMFWLAFSSGVGGAVESLARRAGGSDRLARAAFTMELGLKGEDNLLDAVLAVSVPYKAPAEPESTPQPSPPLITEKPVVTPSLTPAATPAPTPAPSEEPSPEPPVFSPEDIEIKGETEGIDVAALFSEPLNVRLKGTPQILIIHTHSTESYTPEEGDIYFETDRTRTLNSDYNVVRVGEELANALREKGFSVIHDRGVYDYPSYTGSYSRSLEAIESYLKAYPSIKVVIDLHRDALMDAQGNIYKTAVEINGKSSAQVMLVVGTGEGGASNPRWKENLKLAFHLQAAMNTKYKGLARPINISPERYNQHVPEASILVEVGCNGNTLEEALYAVRLFAEAAAEVFEMLK